MRHEGGKLLPCMLIAGIVISFVLALGCGAAPTSDAPPQTLPASSSAVAVSISPRSAVLQPGTSLQFRAGVRGTKNTNLAWLAGGVLGGNSASGAVTPFGLYTAPEVFTPRSIVVAARSAADPATSGNATVIVLPAPEPVKVSISPTAVILQSDHSQQFTATTTGTSNTRVTWFVNEAEGGNSSIGTISSTGVYTPPPVVAPGLSVSVIAKSYYSPTSSAQAHVTIVPSPTPPSAHTYYIDATGGNDTNDGRSPLTAWRTVAKVNSSSFLPGDSILFKRGEAWRERLIVPSSGSLGHVITFGTYGTGNNPVLDGAVRATTFILDTGSIYKINHSEVSQVFEDGNVRLTKATSKSTMLPGSWFWDKVNTLYVWSSDSGNPNTHVTSYSVMASGVNMNGKGYLLFDSIDVTRWGNEGYSAQDISGAHDITVQHATSSWHSKRGFSFAGGSIGANAVSNITLRDDVAHDQLGECFWNGNGTNILVQRNTCYYSDKDISKGYLYDGGGILVGTYANGVTVQDNYVHDIYSAAAVMVEYQIGYKRPVNVTIERNHIAQTTLGEFHAVSLEGDGTIFKNNIVELTFTGKSNMLIGYGALNNKVYNNVFYAGGNWGVVFSADVGTNNAFENNIIHRSVGNGSINFSKGGVGLNGGTIDYNDYYTSGYWQWTDGTHPNTLAAWQAKCRCDLHSLSADPKFVAKGSDYHLQSDSPCRGAGVNVGVTDDYDGNTRPAYRDDIGAYIAP